MAVIALKQPDKQIVCEEDRATLRDYLTKRLEHLRKEAKNAEGRGDEAAFVEGGEMEIVFLFDELLGEQPNSD